MAAMKRGANVALTREIPDLAGIVLGTSWDAGSETALDEDLAAATLLCDSDGKVASAEQFVFFNQLSTPDLSTSRLDEALGEDQEQVEIDLTAVPGGTARIVLVLYVNEGPARRRTLGRLRHCRVRVLNLATNAELVRSEDLAGSLEAETALTLGEIYRRGSDWKFRVVGQGYTNGIAGVAADHGLSL
jgi:tellurium resistance protein TerD